ncbi:MAG TPA: hypothetical protein VI792_03245 [Candidatus Eisenbacteria bacterium]
MDPVTLALLAAGGLGAGIGSTFQNNKQQRYNNQQLDELLNRQAHGQLGLTPQQQDLYTHQMLTPIQATAQQMQNQQAQALAARGDTASGADLARLRTEQARTIAGAQQQAGQQLMAANEAAKLQQRNEIEQRLGEQAAMRRDDYNQILGGITQTAGAFGAAAGAAPGTMTASGMFGGGGGSQAASRQAVPQPTGPTQVIPGLTYEQTQQLVRYYKDKPEQIPAELQSVLGPMVSALGSY